MTLKLHRPVICLWLTLVAAGFALGQIPTRPTDSSPGVVGTWEGTLDAAKLRLVLHIESPKEGALTGRLDSPDQGATDLPLDSVSVANDEELKANVGHQRGPAECFGDDLA